MSSARHERKVSRTASSCLASVVACAWSIAMFASVPASHASTPDESAVGNAVHGAVVYQVCTGCHSLDEDDVGPRHRGVVGREAAAIQGYPYSPALKSSGLVWTPQVLDRWLQNPQALVPGTKMFFALTNAQDRADVIAYLAQQR